MITQKPRGYSVNDFLSWHQKKELVLQPKFQRRDVWPSRAKSHLLDTILRGLPVPLLFIRQQIDPLKKKTVREVVDGQQRLRAVLEFCIPDDPKDALQIDRSVHPKYGGKTFEDLPTEAKSSFLSYEFSVVLLEGASDSEVLDIFARLNTFAQKLNNQELLNAAYYGQFKQTVYGLGYEHLSFWTNMGILSDRKLVRMGEAELVSELLVAMIDGPQTKKEKVKKFYELHDEDFPQKKTIKKQFKEIIDIISIILGNELKHSIFSRPAMFYSLFLVFFDIVFQLPNSPVKSPIHKIHTSDFQKIKIALGALERDYENDHPSISEFKSASLRSTADKRERNIRHRTIYRRIAGAI